MSVSLCNILLSHSESVFAACQGERREEEEGGVGVSTDGNIRGLMIMDNRVQLLAKMI